MIELSLWNENINKRGVTVSSHTQNFDLLARVTAKFAAKAFKGESNVGLADKLNLQTEATLKVLLFLRRDGLLGVWLKLAQLRLERCAMLDAV